MGEYRHLDSWLSASAVVRSTLARKYELRAECIDVQKPVCLALGIDNPLDLLRREWSSDQILDLVAGIDFAAWADFEEIAVADSFLVASIRRIDEETIKFESEKWRIHKYDTDPFPFLPHAHNLSVNVKMDLRNGDQYQTKRYVGSLPRKRLIEFRGRVKRIALPELTV